MAKKINFNEKYYRLSLFLGYDERGKKKYKYFYGDGKQDAEQQRDDYKALLKSGLSDLNPTLNNSLNDWLFDVIKVSGIKDSTFSRYYDHYNSLKKTDLIYMKVNDISAPIIQKVLNKFAESESYNFVHLIRKFLKRHFEYLVGTNIVNRNPIKGVQLPLKAKKKRESKAIDYNPYTLVEKKMLLLYLEQNHPTYWLITSILFAIGAREGEILGLYMKDIKNDILSINTSLAWVKVIDRDGSYHYEYQNDSTKNAASIRSVYLTDELVNYFKMAKIIKNKNKLKLGPLFLDSDLIFTNESGTPISARSYLRYIKNVQKKLNLDIKDIHNIRHTFITECFEKGIDEMTVQEIVGHTKGSNITRDIYTHLRKENKKERMLNALK